MVYQLRNFASLIGGACLAMIIAITMLSVTAGSADAVISLTSGEQAELRAGKSTANVQIETQGELAQLHILILAKPGDSEMITSRVRLQDGQSFSLSVPVDDVSDRANRFTFERRGSKVFVRGTAWSSDSGSEARHPEIRTASVRSFW